MKFNKPTLKRADMYTVLETMVEENIGSGAKEETFSFTFASFVRCKKAYSFRTYTDCINRAFEILGIRKGSLVALSALAPYVYFLLLQRIGAKIVFVDVEEENGLPSAEAVMGSGAEFFVLYNVCSTIAATYNRETTFYQKMDYSGVKILEDITESIGSYIDKDEIYAGAFGNVVLCALEENSVVSAAGGAVLGIKDGVEAPKKEDNPAGEAEDSLDAGITVTHVGGITVTHVGGNENDTGNEKNKGGGKYAEDADYAQICSEYTRLTDLNASLALMQLNNIEADSEKRRSIMSVYTSGLKSSACRRFGISSTEYTSNCSNFSILMNAKPDDFISFAKKKGVPLEKTFKNSIIAHLDSKFYQELPKSASFYSRTISFPIYPFLKSQDIDVIAKTISALP